jgi:hypothetical protein
MVVGEISFKHTFSFKTEQSAIYEYFRIIVEETGIGHGDEPGDHFVSG